MAEELRGWYPDPFNLHELRYFSMDGKPTRLVSNGGRTSHDPPLPQPMGTIPHGPRLLGSDPQTGVNTRGSRENIAPHSQATTQGGDRDYSRVSNVQYATSCEPTQMVRGVQLGYVYESSNGDEPRLDLNAPSSSPRLSAGRRDSTRGIGLVDFLFPNASPSRRASLHRFVRYGSVSAVSTVTSLVVLGTLIGILGYPATWSNVIATVVATVPSFELNRRWVWAQSGEGSVFRKAVPYFLLSFAGLIVSTFAVHLSADATIHSTRLVHTAAAELANVAAYGSLWVVQFLLCDRILFRQSHHAHGVSDQTAPYAQDGMSRATVRAEEAPAPTTEALLVS
jgi:putative flippase GtrA